MEAVKNRGGAPRKADSEKRDRRIDVAFTQEEFERLRKRKENTRTNTLSSFIRTICLDKPMRIKPQLSTHQENVLSLVREMRADVLRIGINVNQSVRRINSTTDYQNLKREVDAMAQEVAGFNEKLVALTTMIERDNPPSQPAYGSANQ